MTPSPPMPGVFFALDGPDGTGKSTQCRLLVERLRREGFAVTPAVDPGGTPLGAKLRELLLFGRELSLSTRTEAMLFMASRSELVAQVIAPALGRGDVVVSDRFVTANVVYQGHALGADIAELWRLGAYSAGGRLPDLTLVFDLPPAVAGSRLKVVADRLESRGEDYKDRVRAGFLAEVAARPETHTLVDASGDAESVADRVWAAVKPRLGLA